MFVVPSGKALSADPDCPRFPAQRYLLLTSCLLNDFIPGTALSSSRSPIVAALVILAVLPLAWGQHSHPSPNSQPESAPTGNVGPDMQTLTRAVLLQARPDQVGFFRSILESTDSALQQSVELQRLGPEVNNVASINARSLQLRDSLDDIEHYQRRFRATLSRFQENELKKLSKRVRKSYSYVDSESKAVFHLLEPGETVPQELASASANLEKALSDFRTDEVRLGREMGIQSQ